MSDIKQLLDYILNEIIYIRTHTDEINVLAECNLIEAKINEYLEDK